MHRNKQGLFHLVSIIFIPAVLVSGFVVQSFWLTITVIVAMVLVCGFLFFKKNKI
ncbi:MAG TPA: hypothetical protein VK177_15760 [Flavobacteriales bacterium]|nr:hypothetical protein [Flavobacteriales bacterium]